MRRGVIFWGVILIVVGTLLLLSTIGVIPAGPGLIWPLLLIAVGVWLVWATSNRPGQMEVQEVDIPLADATRARVSIHHGAGRLNIASGAPPGQLASGRFSGGLDYNVDRAGDALEVRMHIPDQGSRWANPWSWNRGGLDWNMGLASDVPLELELDTGASATEADLSALRLTALHLKTGASSSRLVLPSNAGYTQVEIEGGAASVTLRVPPQVAARILSQGGASSTNVDVARFPRTASGYVSTDYETAANKIDIRANIGAGSVEVR
jgi:hypothetical protein